jgi:hypothetical protein
MITKHTILGDIGVYVHTIEGIEDTGMLWGASMKTILYLSKHNVPTVLCTKYPVHKNVNGKWYYSKGFEFQVQDYDRIVELLNTKVVQ